MGVYIKDMEMPKEGYCDIVVIHSNGEVCRWLAKQNNVPIAEAIEVKEPHGRLIDEDYLKEHVYQCQLNGRSLHRMEIGELLDCISEVPTVIERSE